MYSVKPVNNELFYEYYKTYYGYKYNHYYFRKTKEALLERLTYLNGSCLIYLRDVVVGGAILKAGFIADVFAVAPFKNINELVKAAYLYVLEKSEGKIQVQEAIEEHVEAYTSLGFIIKQAGYWMVNRTSKQNLKIHNDYQMVAIDKENSEGFAKVIYKAYNHCTAFSNVDPVETQQKYVDSFIEERKSDTILNESSKVIVHKTTNEIVGGCMHMIFEELPLITCIAIDPEHQQKGLGTALLKNSLHATQKAYDVTRLYVFKGNPALSLYQSLGFTHNRSINDLEIEVSNDSKIN